ncbi:hypothetical protein LZ554_007276 [Drepanopeziza brunnea f. sp. 'monogermtubi']|nr:hypothetical protein LZ554_007276 [Drepanopeziza brunnea f. sp. 'monogermtubi']
MSTPQPDFAAAAAIRQLQTGPLQPASAAAAAAAAAQCSHLGISRPRPRSTGSQQAETWLSVRLRIQATFMFQSQNLM